jgi:adenylate cyclase
VRFVKSIGDAVMLVCADPLPLVIAALDLLDAAAAYDLPPLRVGVATGCAVTRAGDWFGSPVNVASRVTAAAEPGSMLVAESTRDLIDSASSFELLPVGALQLMGVCGYVKHFVVRRAAG